MENIQWREWGRAALEEGKSSGRLILLDISAVWCHWCHVMDETTYENADVVKLVNDRFIPVRVDNDRRPDLNARYNMGGWPTTALLTADGEILDGRTYVPAAEMVPWLKQVDEFYNEKREEIDTRILETKRLAISKSDDAPEGEISRKIVADVTAAALKAHDLRYGGFGDAPKFPWVPVLQHLLEEAEAEPESAAARALQKTLRAMSLGEIYDVVEDGFFRYATRADWSVPHYEKMLEDNIGLLRIYLRAMRLFPGDSMATPANGVLRYLFETLYDIETGAFFGSQDADEEYYKKNIAGRRAMKAPAVDRTFYAAWNAQAVTALYEASVVFQREEYKSAAERLYAFLRQNLMEPDGSVNRYYVNGKAHPPRMLGDAAAMLEAALAACRHTGCEKAYPDAKLLADNILGSFGSGSGSGKLRDHAADGDMLGRLELDMHAIDENARVARSLLELGRLTDNSRYVEAGEYILKAFAGDYDSYGIAAALYASAIGDWLAPGEVFEIERGADDALVRLCLMAGGRRLARHVEPRPGAKPGVRICAGKKCLEPISDPAELRRYLRKSNEEKG